MIHTFKPGWVPDIPDHRDHLYSIPFFKALPPVVDLSGGFPPCYDQGLLGSCTAQAIAGAIQYNQKLQKIPEVIPSRLFIYYLERQKLGTVDEDSGAMIRDGIKACAKLGVVPEPLWPYEIERYRDPPPESAYTMALEHQLLSYGRVSHYSRGIKSVLAQGFPIVFGFSVYESFMTEEVAATGDVPIPRDYEHQLGGHAVVLTGYNDATRLYDWRNSYGPGWGKRGYGTFPYDYVNSTGLTSDFWVIRLIEEPTAALQKAPVESTG